MENPREAAKDGAYFRLKRPVWVAGERNAKEKQARRKKRPCRCIIANILVFSSAPEAQTQRL